MKKYRNYAMILSVFGMALLLIGVTYSFFNYTSTGGVNNLGTGNISFNAQYGTAINLTNVFPMTSSEVGEANLPSTTVTISGSTNYSDGEEFLVSIVDVNNTVNGKKIPINYIATYEATTGNTIGTSTENYFEATKNSNIYKLNSTGSIVENKQVLVGFIKTGISGTLTIKAYVDADRIAITDTPEENSSWVNGRTVFSTTEWNSLSSNPISFKLRTESNEGTWVEEPERDDITPASCFYSKYFKLYKLNSNMTQTELSDCTNYISSMNISFLDNGTAEGFCLGTSRTSHGNFQVSMDYNITNSGNGYNYDYSYLLEHNIIIEEEGLQIATYDSECGGDIVIPNKMTFKRSKHNTNMTQSELNTCIDYLTNDYGLLVNTSDGETIENFCKGIGTSWGKTFQDYIDNENFQEEELTYLMNNNIINEGENKSYPVLVFGDDSNSAINNQLLAISKLVFGKNIKVINGRAFVSWASNSLTEINIHSGVRYIGTEAFLISVNDGQTININIAGKPFIDSFSISNKLNISYGGTCQELEKNGVSGYSYALGMSVGPFIINGEENGEYYVKTTDTNTCKVYSGNFG